MITRRQFLIGTAAGLILPKWLLKAEQYLRNEGEPLLELPETTNRVLTALDSGNCYWLYLDLEPNPWTQSFTWRELIDRFRLACSEPFEDYDFTRYFFDYNGDLNEKIDSQIAQDFWRENLEGYWHNHKTYELLEKLHIGPKLTDGTHNGLLFYSYDLGLPNSPPLVSAPDEITLSLLQNKLNDLNTGIEVVLSYYV